ncbi:MAG TPA: hypothetical protein V6D29_06185 [Leptolyngbyaceae cyanobacterium]
MRWAWVIRGLLGLVLLVSQGCWGRQVKEPPRKIDLYQDWALQPGEDLAGYPVQSGLGDIALDLKGRSVYMPFRGRIQPEADTKARCVLLSSPEVPAYLFRICGLNQPRLGEQSQGEAIGSGRIVAFATLRKQTDGTWAMVEPAKEMLAQFVSKP